MSEYTPSDNDILGSAGDHLYEYGMPDVNMNEPGNSPDELVDRWLAQHDAAVRADERRKPISIGKQNEPPVGTWVRDKHGTTSYRQMGGGWGQPGMMPLGRWEAMWDARGPYELCGPWGRALSENTNEQEGTKP